MVYKLVLQEHDINPPGIRSFCSSSSFLVISSLSLSLSLSLSTGATDTLATVDEEHPTNRFNDAKCDRLGRLWGGTMGYEDKPGVFSPHMGSLYSYDGGKI